MFKKNNHLDLYISQYQKQKMGGWVERARPIFDLSDVYMNGVNINAEQKQKFLSIRDFNKTSMRQSELLQTKQISYKVMICYLPLILNPHSPKKEQRERERYTNQKKK